MTPDRTADRDRFARAEDLFHRALQLDEPDRARLVDQTPDPAVRDEAVRMLRGHQRAIRSATFIEPPTAFAEPADPFGTPERWVGRTLGRYTLRTLIGTGGMGSVYEADSAFPERKVAVKVVRAAALDTAAQRRFEHEARVLARLQHPGIAQVYEAAIHEDDSARVAFIALELVPGARPLTAWTKQVAASDIPRRFITVCDAVHHGHLKGIIHRDLKPGNVLVGTDSAAKVIDFGIARLADAPAAPETAIGTLAYASPEQCADPADVDTRTDVYALGAMLYELLTARRPIEVNGLPFAQAVHAVRTQSVPPPSLFAPSVSADLDAIILKALAKDRAHRYATAGDLAADLHRSLASEPVAARPLGGLGQSLLFARRHRTLVAACSAVAAALLLSTIVSAAFARSASRAAEVAQAAKVRAEHDRDRALRVAEFLTGALGSANPYLPMTTGPELAGFDYRPYADWRFTPWPYSGAPGKGATVADIAIAAGQRLPETFADDAPSRAMLASALGRTLYHLERSTEAGQLLRLAHESSREGLERAEHAAVRAALQYAQWKGRWENDGRQSEVLRTTLEACRRVYGPGSPQLIEVTRCLAFDLFAYRGQNEKARALISAEVRDAAAAGLADAPHVLELQSYAAYLAASYGDHPNGAPLARAALTRLEQVAPAAPHIIETRRNLAQSLLLNPSTVADAPPVFAQALSDATRLFGPGSFDVFRLTVELADAHQAAGELAAAIEHARRAVALSSALLSDQSYESYSVRLRLAAMLYTAGTNPEERVELLRAALPAMQANTTPQEFASASWAYRYILADAQWSLNQTAPAAEATLRDLITEADGLTALNPPPFSVVWTGVARYRLAARLIAGGRAAEAHPFVTDARRILTPLGPEANRARAALAEIEKSLPPGR